MTQSKKSVKTVGLSTPTRYEVTTEIDVKKARRRAEDDAKASARTRAEQDRTTMVANLSAFEDQHTQQESTKLYMYGKYLLVLSAHGNVDYRDDAGAVGYGS